MEPAPVGGGSAARFAAALKVIAGSILRLGAGHSAISDPPPTGAGSVAIGSPRLPAYKIVALKDSYSHQVIHAGDPGGYAAARHSIDPSRGPQVRSTSGIFSACTHQEHG